MSMRPGLQATTADCAQPEGMTAPITVCVSFLPPPQGLTGRKARVRASRRRRATSDTPELQGESRADSRFVSGRLRTGALVRDAPSPEKRTLSTRKKTPPTLKKKNGSQLDFYITGTSDVPRQDMKDLGYAGFGYLLRFYDCHFNGL